MNIKTIQKHKDFFSSPKEHSCATPLFVLKTHVNPNGDAPRYGIVVSKRLFKLAVQRNRAKRLLRDWIAFNEQNMLDNMDYIFIARFAILDSDRETGRAMVHNAIRQLSIHHGTKK